MPGSARLPHTKNAGPPSRSGWSSRRTGCPCIPARSWGCPHGDGHRLRSSRRPHARSPGSRGRTIRSGAPDLLLALDDELQVDRRPTFDALPCLDREELHDEVALRVRAASAPELAVLDRRVERIPLPFVQRVDRLDVVMLVHEERRLALVDDHLTEDDVRPAVR